MVSSMQVAELSRHFVTGSPLGSHPFFHAPCLINPPTPTPVRQVGALISALTSRGPGAVAAQAFVAQHFEVGALRAALESPLSAASEVFPGFSPASGAQDADALQAVLGSVVDHLQPSRPDLLAVWMQTALRWAVSSRDSAIVAASVKVFAALSAIYHTRDATRLTTYKVWVC